MSKRIALLSAAFSVLALTATITAPARAEEKTVMVGGAAMFPSKNIVENAVNSKDHTTLVAAVKAAGLVDTLQSKGPFTVFAPTNAAFGKLPAGTVDTLVKPESKPTPFNHCCRSLCPPHAANFSISAMTASPICDVVTILAPSDLMSAVRSPLSSVAAIALSIRSASLPMSNE